jgi:serine protease Do
MTKIAKDILEFFHQDNIVSKNKQLNFGDFLNEYPKYLPADKVFAIINKLLLESKLVLTDYQINFHIRGNCYQTLNYNREDGEYGSYDFGVFGFKLIRQEFSESVLPIVVKGKNDDLDIGTGFIIEYNFHTYLITAAHCVNHGEEMIIFYKNIILTPIYLYLIEKPEYIDQEDDYSNIDIAIFEIDTPILNGCKKFKLEKGEILDEVLILGYPPVGLFDKGNNINNAIQLAETSSIASEFLKASDGQITAEGYSAAGKQDYLIINARVKGGSSGSPVINSKGKVIGMVTQIKTNEQTSDGSSQNDPLGFGFATPFDSIVNVLELIQNKSGNIKAMPINITEWGFKIKN